VQAYPHRGRVLKDLVLHDYMSIATLKRKGEIVGAGPEESLNLRTPGYRRKRRPSSATGRASKPRTTNGDVHKAYEREMCRQRVARDNVMPKVTTG